MRTFFSEEIKHRNILQRIYLCALKNVFVKISIGFDIAKNVNI